MQTIDRFKRSVLMQAVWVLVAMAAGQAQAAIVTSGLVSPDPTSGTVNTFLNVGGAGVGSLTVNGGSVLNALRVDNASKPTGTGTIVVTGAGSVINTNFGPLGGFYNANIGGQGKGHLSVLDGGLFNFGSLDPTCKASCRLHVSSGAGSEGSVLVSGAGSAVSGLGGVRVGFAGYYTQAVSGFNWGTAGGASVGSFAVQAGGSATSAFLEIGAKDLPSEMTGSETSTGSVVVDGVGSVWNLVRNSAQNGGQALLRMATAYGTDAMLEVKNGGVVKLDGSSAPDQQTGINVGVAPGGSAPNANGTITVKGAGSRLELSGGVGGFINLGRGAGVVADLNVQDGGVVTGTSENGLAFLTVGRSGATATLNVSGPGSLLRLSGVDAAGSGAFLNVGRFDTGAAGTGNVNITGGGRIEIDNSNQVLTSSNQTGMIVGNGPGSTGTMSISGAGSVLQVAGSTGRTPYLGIGRDGGSGQLTISAGGRLEVNSEHTSVPNAPLYLPGDAVFLAVGSRSLGADGLPSTGTLTVTGAGSEVSMSGAADRILQVGRGSGGSGTLNITHGGTVRSLAVLVGDGAGATGALNMNGGILLLDGQRSGGPGSPGGAGLSIGRGDGGIGVATIGNGSLVSITTTAPNGGIGIGGSTIDPGGSGTMLVSGGSTVNVHGPSVAVTAGSLGTNQNAGSGTLVLEGAGTTMTVTGAQARVLAGNFVGSTGLISVGAGATLSTSGLVGVAHNGTGASGGTGLLVVDGTVNANQVFLAPGGILAGNGTINADVVNQGGIRVGASPGRMTFNGAFDSDHGQILLEIEALAGGGYAVDELVFGDPSQVFIGGAEIVFKFLGDTDPVAFLDSGSFELATFFKEMDGLGNVIGIADAHRDRFDHADFSATSDRFEIRSFSFDPIAGVTIDVANISEPSSLALLLVALLALLRRRAGWGDLRLPTGVHSRA